MSNLAREITKISIEEELKNSYLDYAMSVIIGRALPDVRDGLKPVHRRILFAMSMLGNDWNKPYKKSARIVGDVIGKYHPHGDTAVYDAIVRMAQFFSLRYMLIDGQGNFGSIDGDSAAAMRYTEIRMSKISHELLSDLEKETVDYVYNYDGSEQIPNVMPTRIPNLLINGSSGIAVGMATNIAPHNIKEVINGCLAYIDNEKITLKELMKSIPGPDFPTSAIIQGKLGIENAYRTGKGKIYIRAKTKVIIDDKSKLKNIIVYELPYQVNKANLIEKIAELIKLKKIDGINTLRDESDKDGIRIVIVIKRDAVTEIVLNNLYSLTQLQVSFGINMVALYKGKPKTLTLKEILSAFLCHRREVVSRRTIFELRNARDRVHIIEAMIVALLNIDLIIKCIRKEKTIISAKSSLLLHPWELKNASFMLKYTNNHESKPEWLEPQYGIHNNKYYLTEKQAQSILDLRLQKLTSLEYEKLINEYKKILFYINKLNQILKNPKKLIQVIKEELIAIKEQYGDSRRTEIIEDNSEINIEDMIHQKDVVVTLSHRGYIKYQPLTDYEAQKRGGKGKSATSIKEEDFISCLLVANTHDIILMFSSRGRIYWMKVYQLPEASRFARGRPIVNLLPLKPHERITAILPLRDYEEGRNIFMATASGIVKKTALIEFSNPRSSGIIGINLNNGDELIGVDLTDGNNDIMLFSAYGKVVRFPENQVRSMKRTATGVKGINLLKGDRVVSLIVPQGHASILTVTQYGYGKRTDQEKYPTKSRATQGVISIKVNKNRGEVVGAMQVNESDQIMMITNAGTLIRTRVSEVSTIGRNTQGVTLIRTVKDEKLVGLQRIVEPLLELKDINLLA